MASKETSGQSETTQATASSSDDLTSSLTEEGEPPIEVIPVGDDPPIDDKPVIGDEPPVDQESEGYTAEREALRVLHERITELGFDSVFELMREGSALVRAKILSRTPQVMDPVQVDELFDQAQARAAGLTRLYAQLCARSNPTLQALTKLEPPEDPNGIHRSIGGSGNYEAWFKQTSATGFAHPDSVGSLFSPASYLTDLYRAAKPLHPSTSGLQLNLRRPDLAPLLLSDANLNEEVSTLALTLEVLEAGVAGDVDELLRTALHPMNLPYNHASEQILQGMAARKSSPAELWSVLGDFEGQALKHETNLLAWSSRMPVNHARDALGMSPELATILTQAQNTSEAGVMRYFGLTRLNEMEYASGLQAALQVPVDVIVSALGSGPFFSLSAPEIVLPQTYAARYINGWTDGTPAPAKPLYWYVGAAVGHLVPAPANSPPSSGFYNRNGRAFERLNRIFRLHRHVKQLSFEELDWLVCQASDTISVHPLTQPLQALAVYLPLRQRYAMTVDSFAACLGLLNTFHGAGQSSFFTSLFGDEDLIDLANIDFQQATQNPPSLSARARLCQGLKIDDATLIVLAQFLPTMGANKVLPMLGLEQISALYRLVAIPRVFGLSVVEALHFWDELADPDAIVRALAQPQPNQVALGVLIRTGYLVDWMRNAKLEPQQLMALTSRRYPVQATPELQVFIENIYSTLSGRAVVEAALQATEDAVLRTQLARHIGAEFNLKPNIATAALVWVDAVAEEMTSNLEGYNLLSFWADIERVGLGAATLDELPQAVQYAYLMRQFAQACHWAQLGEQDLDVLLPAGAGKPSALTGELNAPALTLELLLLLSRYRKWQQVLVVEVAEARTFLLRAAAQDPALTLEVAALQLSDLHGWDLTQTLVLMNASVPRSFAALLPLLHTMQLSQRLGVSPTDMSWVAKLTGTAVVDQATLTVIAAKIIAAAHA
ncbi:Tc toxin subunit A [Pseudomonas psychrophila]|uniref:Toxin n=1 Tax=Pseudomonas psychrophila TaxID=122355 RepID=A0A8I1FQ79_9PSED|nr:Tc toxin subunit A [Pseudomonas psychrophila]MBJ2255026.1 hypothetical protein [Pseudomonas psychrophila]